MSKDNRLARIWRVLTKIQARPGISIGSLAEDCEISERTVYRDLDILKQSGIPLYFDGGYRVMEDFFLSPLKLTLPEGMALAIGIKTWDDQKGIPYAGAASTALDKVTAAMPPAVREAIKTYDRDFQVGDKPVVDYSGLADLFELIEQARCDAHTIGIDYQSLARQTPARRLVDPYALFFKLKKWYMVAFCHLRMEVRLFRVDRIAHVELTERTFTKPDSFSLMSFLGDAWGVIGGTPQRVTVQFRGQSARVVREGQWHHTQEMDDNGETVDLTFMVAGPTEMIPWLLTFGGEAEILEPLTLREEVLTRAQAVLANHEE